MENKCVPGKETSPFPSPEDTSPVSLEAESQCCTVTWQRSNRFTLTYPELGPTWSAENHEPAPGCVLLGASWRRGLLMVGLWCAAGTMGLIGVALGVALPFPSENIFMRHKTQTLVFSPSKNYKEVLERYSAHDLPFPWLSPLSEAHPSSPICILFIFFKLLLPVLTWRNNIFHYHVNCIHLFLYSCKFHFQVVHSFN